MTTADLYRKIEDFGYGNVKVYDLNNNLILSFDNPTAPGLVEDLRANLPAFSGLKRVKLDLKKAGTGYSWTKDAVHWLVELQEAAGSTVNGIPVASADAGIGTIVTLYDKMYGMMIGNLEAQSNLQIEIATIKANQNKEDRMWNALDKYAPYLGEAVGLKIPAAMAGPAKTATKETVNLEFANMDSDAKNKKIDELMTSLAAKINGTDFLTILASMDANPTLAGLYLTLLRASQSIDSIKLMALLQGLIKNPALADQALQFIK